jgi:predicted HTH domain antitoxin
MRSITLAEFKKNPSGTLRKARKTPVVITEKDHPEAIIFHLDDGTLLTDSGVRPAIAAALFKEGHISLGNAARIAEMPLAVFIPYLGSKGIPTIKGTAEDVDRDLEVLRKWGKSS